LLKTIEVTRKEEEEGISSGSVEGALRTAVKEVTEVFSSAVESEE
jgi:hypothetical protein